MNLTLEAKFYLAGCYAQEERELKARLDPLAHAYNKHNGCEPTNATIHWFSPYISGYINLVELSVDLVELSVDLVELSVDVGNQHVIV